MEELLELFRLGLRWAEPEAGAVNEARVPGSWEPKILRVAPGDDVLDELQSRRHQMASWPRGEEAETHRCWERLDDADESLQDAAGYRVAAAPFQRLLCARPVRKAVVVGGCCCEFDDRSELAYGFAVLGDDREAEVKAVPRRRDREVPRRSRHPLELELVLGEQALPVLHPCQEYGREIPLECENGHGRDQRTAL